MKLKQVALAAACGLWSIGVSAEDGQSPLTRVAAIARVLNAAPALEAAKAAVEARNALVDQAGTRPNPHIGLEVENFTGTGPYTELDRVEATASYSQLIERGGKRARRVAVSEEDKRIAAAELRVRRLDLAYEAERAFIEAVAATARHDALVRQASVLAGTERLLAERASAGRESDLAVSQARIRTLRAENAMKEAALKAETAKLLLAGLWGGADAGFVLEPGFFAALPAALPSLAALSADTPDMVLWRLREDRQSAMVALEQARGVQDPTVRLGLRYLQDSGEVAAVAGISIPFALYDTNRGNIARAKSDLNQSRFETLEMERRLNARFLLERQHMASAFVEAGQLRKSIAEVARTVDLARAQVAKGAASHLDVFAAEQLVADFEGQLIDALAAYHMARAGLARLNAEHDSAFDAQGN
ncbi:TolC family protein [Gimibacter soli]|uniref:TolC family protein n=1 Tax=Gimibacter soli TaxID=3024400 RepID=A0AAE9XTC6_9PROT|nr:TolC family protein [Gimibacter soli]WCL53870.1 TolC family protein [Gimibacter soli]